jgi:hypothetical protein
MKAALEGCRRIPLLSPLPRFDLHLLDALYKVIKHLVLTHGGYL